MGNLDRTYPMQENVKYSKFVIMFSDFLRKGVMAGTYKVVFLRALTDLGKYGKADLIGKHWISNDGNKIKLDLNFIAIRFIKYYWDMEIAFKMKHMPKRMADADDPVKDELNITKQIHVMETKLKKKNMIETINKMNSESMNQPKYIADEITDKLKTLIPPTLEELASDEMKEFRDNVIMRSIKPEVLPNLLNDMPELYERQKGQNYILLEPTIIDFMKDFYLLLRKALNCVLAEHLEKVNPSARHIAIKIDSEKTFETRLNLVRKLEMQVESKSEQKPTKSEYAKNNFSIWP